MGSSVVYSPCSNLSMVQTRRPYPYYKKRGEPKFSSFWRPQQKWEFMSRAIGYSKQT